MPKLVFSQLAEQNITSILEFIAEDNASAAANLIAAIHEACYRLADFPEIGTVRPKFRGGDIRSFPVGNHVIFYRIRESSVEVARVIHGARDILSLLGEG